MHAREIERLTGVARKACDAASSELAARFGARIDSSIKPDGTLVTEADRAAEEAILGVLRQEDPGAAVLTEESGALGEGADRWIVDPLDGTARFARGHASWGPLLAREAGGEVVACALATPAREASYWAGRGLGAWRDGRRLRVSSVDRWEEAILAIGSLPRLLAAPCADGAMRLARACSYCAAGGDLAGAIMVASGQAEVWIECGVHPWDTAPMGLLVREAGGTATDLTDHRRLGAGSAILLSNGALHDHALRALLADG